MIGQYGVAVRSAPHDRKVTALVVEYPREALAFFTPDEAPEPDDEASFVPVRQELLKERLGGRFRALDTPMLVEWADGRREAVVFALEEESDRRRFSPHLPDLRVHPCRLAEMPAERWIDSDNLVARVTSVAGVATSRSSSNLVKMTSWSLVCGKLRQRTQELTWRSCCGQSSTGRPWPPRATARPSRTSRRRVMVAETRAERWWNGFDRGGSSGVRRE